MNKIYRIVFNAVTGRWGVASELATGRKKQGGGERVVVAAVLVTGALGSLMGAAHAGVVVNGDPQEAVVGCELITDSGATTWTASASAGACLAPSLAGSASGQGNPGADAVFYASNKTNGSEDSLNLGGYLDAWKTATFHGGIAMDGQKITGLANGTAATDAATFGQLNDATRYIRFVQRVPMPRSAAQRPRPLPLAAAASRARRASVSVLAKLPLARKHMRRHPIPSPSARTLEPRRMAYYVANTTDLIAVGTNAEANYGHSVAIGGNAKALPPANGSNGFGYAVALGDSASVTSDHGSALGALSSVTANDAVALGYQSVADRANTISVGSAAKQRQIVNVADGTAATDAATFGQLNGATRYFKAGGLNDGTDNATAGALGVAIGAGAYADSGSFATSASVALGARARANSNSSQYDVTPGVADAVAIGSDSSAAGAGAIALGPHANANFTNIAIGAYANVSGARNSIAIGQAAKVSGFTAVALGTLADASANNSVALGYGTVADRVNAVSVGSATTQRQVMNMAKGTADTDAVNVAQLKGVTTAIGGAAAVNADGTITAPSYALSNANTIGATSGAAADVGAGFDKVDTALGKLNTAVAQNATNIAGNTSSITSLQTTVNNITNGTAGLVQQSAAGANLTVGKGTDGAAVDFADKNGTARKLLKVAAGTVASGSTDAVNGGQLYTTNQNVAQNTADISSLGGRVTTAEGNISTLNTNVTNLGGRVTTAESNITNLQNTVNNISNGSVGLVQQSAAGADLTVGKGTDGVAVDFADKNGAARKLKGVAIGDVTSTSTDAVNGSQLYATNQVVAQNTTDIGNLDTRMGTAEDNITTLDNRVTTNEGDISTIKTDVTKIDGRVTTAEGNINTLNTNVSKIDGRVTNVEGSVANITNQLNSGEIGLVQYDDAAGIVTVAKDKAGTAVDFRGSAGARRLKGVAAGGEDEDAVNVSQLKKVADAIGGGAKVNADGSITAPTYYVTNADGSKSSVTNMGDAMTNLDGRVYNNTTQIQSISTQISSGTIGMVQQAGAGQKLTVGTDTDGSEVDFADKDGNARKLTNVADGKVEAGSKDAVNGGQLHAVSQSMASALGGGSVVNADGTVTAPTYTVTNADGSSSQVSGVEGAISNIDNRVYQNTTAITNNTAAINTLSTQISNGEVGLVKQDAATRQITVAKDSDGTSVSVAGTAGDRVVTGVAAAKADNDAVNLGQLKSAGIIAANGEAKSVVTYDDAGKSSMTMGGEGATTAVTIHNVADGVADHDAVNVSQLNQRLQQNTTEVLVQANSYTDQKLGDVWTGMDKLSNEMAKQDGRISSQGAMSMAEAQMASGAAAAAVGNPNGAWSVGLGSEQGHGAISAGYAKPVGRKSQISFGAAFGGDDHSVGVGFAHKL